MTGFTYIPRMMVARKLKKAVAVTRRSLYKKLIQSVKCHMRDCRAKELTILLYCAGIVNEL